MLRQQTAEENLNWDQLTWKAVAYAVQGIVVYGPDMRFREWNPVMEKLTDVPQEKVLGKHPCEAFPLLQETGVMEKIKSALQGEQPPETEFAFSIPETGKTGWVKQKMIPIRSDEGKVVGVVDIVRDITERKKAEKALQESEEAFRLIFERSPIGMFIANYGFRFVKVNAAFCRMVGYTELELSSLTLEHITRLEDLNKDKPHADELRCGKTSLYRTGKCLARKNGEIVCGAMTVTALRNDRGDFSHFLVMIEDVTDRKRAEDALMESEARYSRIVNTTNEGVVMIGADETIAFANQQLAKATGYSVEELTGKPVESFIFEKELKDYRKKMKERQRGKAGRFERWYKRKDASLICMEVSVVPLMDDQNRYQGSFAMFTDITQRKKAEADLKAAVEKLRLSLNSIIDVLSMTVEARDPYTSGHQKRVSNLAHAIALEMDLSEEMTENIRTAGLIHDLGKLSIPTEILTKPSKPTEHEMGLIRMHPQTGYDILKEAQLSCPIAEIVLQHHERFNGTGYPRGLKGNDILLEARIISVADVIEAIATHRPYRGAIGLDAALEEIERNSGILYDPDVVDVCLRLFREKGHRL